MRQLCSRLYHTNEHSCERSAIQVTLVPGSPTRARQFHPRRFVYCYHRIFRQRADSQGALQRSEAQQSQRAASLSMLGSGGGVDDGLRTDPVATGGVMVATSSDGLGSTPLVEGNGGPWVDIGENRATHADAAIFGDANTTHILSSSLEVKEHFDMDEYVDWNGNGNGYLDRISH